MVTKEQLKEGLAKLGVAAGEHVMLHSSLKSFGALQGGAETVLDAILETVGEDGTLLVPTFPFRGSVTVYLRGLHEIDLRSAPSQMGIITETARIRPDFIRSIHPTHPVAGKGKLAEALLSEHHLGDTPAGSKSPFGKLAVQERGRILLAGIGNSSNTMIHTAEEYYTPYIFNGEAFTVEVTTPASSIAQVRVRGYCVNVSRTFPIIDPFLEEADAIKREKIGESMVTLIDARKMMDVLRMKLEENPYLLIEEQEREAVRRGEHLSR